MLLESARLRAGLWHIMAILARHRPSSWHVFQRKLWCTKQSQLIVYRETYMRLNLATTCEDHLHSCPFLPPINLARLHFLAIRSPPIISQTNLRQLSNEPSRYCSRSHDRLCWLLSLHGYCGKIRNVLRIVVIIPMRFSICVWKQNDILHKYSDHFLYAHSQWEVTLQCNFVIHWLSAFSSTSDVLCRVML